MLRCFRRSSTRDTAIEADIAPKSGAATVSPAVRTPAKIVQTPVDASEPTNDQLWTALMDDAYRNMLGLPKVKRAPVEADNRPPPTNDDLWAALMDDVRRNMFGGNGGSTR